MILKSRSKKAPLSCASAPRFLENENTMSLKNKTIAFIGAGNMGEALIRGLLAAAVADPQQIIPSDVRSDRLVLLVELFHIRTVSDNPLAVRQSELALLPVKPPQIAQTFAGMARGMNGRKRVS